MRARVCELIGHVQQAAAAAMADLHVEADEEVNGVPTYEHGVPTLGTLAGSFLPNGLPKSLTVERRSHSPSLS